MEGGLDGDVCLLGGLSFIIFGICRGLSRMDGVLFRFGTVDIRAVNVVDFTSFDGVGVHVDETIFAKYMPAMHHPITSNSLFWVYTLLAIPKSKMDRSSLPRQIPQSKVPPSNSSFFFLSL